MQSPKIPNTPTALQLLNWVFRPMPYMEECTKRYGDVFALKLQKKIPPIVFVSHPQDLQQILAHDTKELEAPGDLNSLFEGLLGKRSLISLSGEEHQRQRQLMMPPLHGERMRAYSQIINDITTKVISQYPVGQPFNIRTVSQEITLRVIMQAVFGLDEGLRAEQLQQKLKEILENGSSVWRVVLLYFPALQKDFGPIKIWGRQQKLQQEADKLIYEEIQARREHPDSSRTDILSLLMDARDTQGQPMTDVELRDELMTLLVAGHETTATAIAWAMYWIHKLPQVKEKIIQELDSLGDNPDPNTIYKLPYLSAVCSETLRIYPVGMLTFPRRVKTSITVSGCELPPGTPVIGSIYLAHQREDIYPQPKQFRPERFLEKQFSPFEYLPFGAGARRCIGLAFAQWEMKLAIAKMLTIRDLDLADRTEVKPKRRGLVTGPNRPIQMVVKSQRQIKSRSLETTTVG